jgi:BASS family bile acid:Na+ symporter
MHVLAFFYFPFGLQLRSLSIGQATWIDGNSIDLSIPVLLLSFLLFNAGIGTNLNQLHKLFQNPLPLLLGLLGNLATPFLFTLALLPFSTLWHNHHQIQSLLMGIAVIGSMPIAGSSTAWAQNSNGNMVLSLGLIIFSTLLSPLSTPIILHCFGSLTQNNYSHQLHQMAEMHVSAFLFFSVVIPSSLGIITHRLIGENWVMKAQPILKTINSIVLLILIYSNASMAIPQAFSDPDWQFLFLISVVTLCLCLAAFGAGWLIGKILKATKDDTTSLIFGLGMNNNATGLVFSSITMSDKPLMILPIIFYNLTQQIIATIISSKIKLQEEPDNQFNEKSVL